MVVGQVDLPLEKIAEICRKYRVRELSIFGSALRGDFGTESDVDLLVDFVPAHGLDLVDYIRCQDELGAVLGRRVDLVQKPGLKRVIREEILRTSKVIYAI
jgi:predicted nucleotidyltransferase